MCFLFTMYDNPPSCLKRESEILNLDENLATPRNAKACGISQSGGARRDRTDDLMLAKHALSQLSYGPVRELAAMYM